MIASAMTPEEGFQRLEEERRLRALVSELESAAASLQVADMRASTVKAIQEAMREALGKFLAGDAAGVAPFSNKSDHRSHVSHEFAETPQSRGNQDQ